MLLHDGVEALEYRELALLPLRAAPARLERLALALALVASAGRGAGLYLRDDVLDAHVAGPTADAAFGALDALK